MKKILIGLALVASLAVASCSIESTDSKASEKKSTTTEAPVTTQAPTTTAAPTTTEAPPTTVAPVLSPEELFEEVLASEGIFLPAEVGHAICDVIDVYGYLDEFVVVEIGDTIVTAGVGYGYSEAGFILGASVPAFCPEYTSQLESLISEASAF